jgi:hypothetical protein
MTHNMLTRDEYNVLQEARNSFDLLNQNVQDIPNPGADWLLRMQPIYRRVFSAPNPNIGCRGCIINCMNQLRTAISAYEAANQPVITLIPTNEQSINTTEPESGTTDKASPNKGRGRQPKSW